MRLGQRTAYNTNRVEYRKGNPKNPMTMEELAEKCRIALRVGKTSIKITCGKVIQLVNKLEEADNVDLVIWLLG